MPTPLRFKKLFKRYPLLKTLAVFLLIFMALNLIYFLFYLYPAIRSARYLANAKSVLTANSMLLQQERVAHTALIRLPADRFNYNEERLTLLGRASEDRERIIKDSGKDVKSGGNKDTQKILRPIVKDLPQLAEDSVSIVEAKKGIYGKYTEVSTKLAQIFDYDPSTDLKLTGAEKELEVIAERASSAVQGLNKIMNDLEKSNLVSRESYLALNDEVTKVNKSLNEVVAYANSGSSDKVKQSGTKAANDYKKLKSVAKTITNQPLNSQEALTLLGKQTELLNKYDLYIRQISDAQRKLNTNPLKKFNFRNLRNN